MSQRKGRTPVRKSTNGSTPGTSRATSEPLEPVEGQFTVERILDKRIKDGLPQYLIKWEGYGNSDNSWEPEANILDTNLILVFENQRRTQNSVQSLTPVNGSSSRGNSNPGSSRQEFGGGSSNFNVNKVSDPKQYTALKTIGDHEEESGRLLREGHIPLKILGVTDDFGTGHHFLVKWRGLPKPTFVPKSVLNTEAPQFVIKFYESKLTFH
jgi:hypothetical protein